MASEEKVIVIDFGGQYNQLVARRVRECNVYCEIYSYRTPIEQIKEMAVQILDLHHQVADRDQGPPVAVRPMLQLVVQQAAI